MILYTTTKYQTSLNPSLTYSNIDTITFSTTTYPNIFISGEEFFLIKMGMVNSHLSFIFAPVIAPYDSSRYQTFEVNTTNFGTNVITFNFFVKSQITVNTDTEDILDIATQTITYGGTGRSAIDSTLTSILYGDSYTIDIDFSLLPASAITSPYDYLRITVTMGGVDISSSVITFSDTPNVSYHQFGDIDISPVTDDITITCDVVTAPSLSAGNSGIYTVYTSGYYLYGTTISNVVMLVDLTTQLNFDTYRMTIDGVDVTNDISYNSTFEITGDVVIYMDVASRTSLDIVDKDNNVLLAITTNNPPYLAPSLITHISFTKSGTTYTITGKQLRKDAVLHTVFNATFTSSLDIVGLGIKGTIYNETLIALGSEDLLFDGNLLASLTSLLAIEEPSEEVTTFSLNLYENNSDDKEVYKDITSVGTATGSMRTVIGSSVINLAVDIELSNGVNFNYVYIPILKRYYYVTSYDLLQTNMYRLHLYVDVLMSYKDQIVNQKVMVLRNEFEFDDTLNDNEMPLSEELEFEIVEPTNQDQNFLNKPRGSYDGDCKYILTVLNNFYRDIGGEE